MTILKPKPGLSAPKVRAIPERWSASWFLRFIQNHLSGFNGNGVDTPAIVINSSATSTKTLQASPAKYIPVQIDGVVHYIQAFLPQ